MAALSSYRRRPPPTVGHLDEEKPHVSRAGHRQQALFSRFHEAINSGDAEMIAKTIDELVAPDVLFHAPAPIDATGVQAHKQVRTVLLRAFPDLRVTIEVVIAEGDKVVYRNTVTGTHRGEYRGHGVDGQIRHLQRDLHLPVRRRPDRRDLGSWTSSRSCGSSAPSRPRRGTSAGASGSRAPPSRAEMFSRQLIFGWLLPTSMTQPPVFRRESK
ncbi:ester cyclase [Nonomuraea fuscirosea]|uniref:ester cyclase n=1 Tax=Nonomuraea fuscirosea TaxID=1291556 RepID=UPI002DD8DA10|nr:ester cyclase [Nonomuraea fuscirosea]WSA56386.1 ester cyclase [Nonomuraea fuscirosea]